MQKALPPSPQRWSPASLICKRPSFLQVTLFWFPQVFDELLVRDGRGRCLCLQARDGGDGGVEGASAGGAGGPARRQPPGASPVSARHHCFFSLGFVVLDV
jgi:hypothetical protein